MQLGREAPVERGSLLARPRRSTVRRYGQRPASLTEDAARTDWARLKPDPPHSTGVHRWWLAAVDWANGRSCGADAPDRPAAVCHRPVGMSHWRTLLLPTVATSLPRWRPT